MLRFLQIRAIRASLLAVGILTYAAPMTAQMQIGNEVTLNGNGNVGFGYSGSYGDGGSSHGDSIGGNAYLSGSYYSPSFLNFTVQPFYGRNQANSNYQSISDSSGIGATLGLFSGSHTPGYITFSDTDGSSGSYGMPGTSGIETHGNTKSFGIGWNAIYPDLPTLSVNFMKNDSSSSIYGSDALDSSTSDSLILRSSYKFRGFNFGGGFTHQNGDSEFPDLLSPTLASFNSHSNTNSYDVEVAHPLPLQGEFTTNYDHIAYSYGTDGNTSSDGSSNSLNASVSFRPFSKLSTVVTGQYTDNILGSIQQQMLSSTGQVVAIDTQGKNDGERILGSAYYQAWKYVGISGFAGIQRQCFLGHCYMANQFGGNANFNYDKGLMKGLTLGVGMSDNANQVGNSNVGFIGTLNYARKINGWIIGAGTNYSQNVQTLLLVYAVSTVSFNGSVARKFGEHTRIAVGANHSRSVLAQQSGDGSHIENFNTSLAYRGYTLTGFYGQSAGTTIVTNTGLVLVPTQVPTALLPTNTLTNFNGTSYGSSFSASPIAKMNFSLSYSRSRSDSIGDAQSYFSGNQFITGQVQYQLRKLYLTAGYTNFHQSLVNSTSIRSNVTAFYGGISRWFNLF